MLCTPGGRWKKWKFKNNNPKINRCGGRVGVTLPYDSAIGVVYRYNKNDTGVPVKSIFPPPQPIVPIINPNAKQQTETTVLSVDAKTHPVEWWEARGRFGRYTNNQGFQDPVDPGVDFDFAINSQVDTERLEYDLLNSIIIGPWSTSTVGFGYRYEHGDNRHVFQASQNVKWFMFEQQFRFFNRLFITGGTRIEDNNVFGNAITGQGSVLFFIKETCRRLRGSAVMPLRASRLRFKCLELCSEIDVFPILVASFIYTYTDTDNLSTGRPIARIPRNAGSAGLTWEPLRGLSFFTQVYVVSSQFDSYGDVYNSGHTRVDAGGTYRILNQFGWLQRLELVARDQNILNES
jgi:outer membrane cobalamin receptor